MSDTTPAAAAPPNDLARSTPGEYLRKLREEKGLTHAAVGSALHLTVHYIKALEGDEYGKLPGLTFVKGYLRSYARFLGADVDNVIARFDEHITGLLDAGQHTARIERSKRRQDQALRWAIGAGLVVVAGVAAGWWVMRDAGPAATTAQRGAASAAVSQPLAASTTSASIAPPAANATPVPASLSPSPAVPPDAAEQPASGTLPGEDDTLPPAVTGLNPPALAPPDDSSATTPAPAVAENFSADVSASPADANAATTTATPQSADAVGTTASAAAAASATTAPANDAGAATPPAGGARQVSLIGAGDDELNVRFTGNSWIEVDDGNMVRLYNAMLSAGDTLTIRGQAPFRVLLGAASNADVSLNATPVDFSSAVRADNTARLVLGATASGTQANADAAAQSPAASGTTPAPAAATTSVPAAATTPAGPDSTDAEVSQ